MRLVFATVLILLPAAATPVCAASLLLNGSCVYGQCANPATLPVGQSTSFNYDFFFTESNTDRYEFQGNVSTNNGGSAQWSILDSWTLTFLGNSFGTGILGSVGDVITFGYAEDFAKTYGDGPTTTNTLRASWNAPDGWIEPSYAQVTMSSTSAASGVRCITCEFEAPAASYSTMASQLVTYTPFNEDARIATGGDVFLKAGTAPGTMVSFTGSAASFAGSIPSPTPAPEPDTWLLMAVGIGGLLFARRFVSRGCSVVARSGAAKACITTANLCRTSVLLCLFLLSTSSPGQSLPGQSLKDRLRKKAEEMVNKGATSTSSQSKASSSSSPQAGTYPPNGSGSSPTIYSPNGSSQSGGQTAGYAPNKSIADLNKKAIISDVVAFEGKNYYTMATYRIDLFAIHKKPDLITDEFLNGFATTQVGMEENLWKTWYGKNRRGESTRMEFPPKVWEWQTLIDEQPDFAKGPLLDTFLFPQADWSFARDTSDLSRTNVDVFLFSRSKIEGRDESFVAREVQPLIKKQLLLAAERSPQTVWIPLKLPLWDWDSHTDSIRFLTGSPGTPFMEAVTILEPQLPNAVTAGVPHPASYPNFYIQSLIVAPQHPQEIKPGMAGSSPTGTWREDSFWTANGRSRFPSFTTLALDRKVEIREIKVPVSQAEQLHKGHVQMSARLLLDMQDIGIAPHAAMNNFDGLCVYASVKKIDIVDKEGAVIFSIDGASLPAGSAIPEKKTAATAPLRTVAPPPGEHSRTDQFGQATKDENARREEEFQIQKHARTHDERIGNCAVFATKRYPDIASEEHRKWNEQCAKQVSAQEAGGTR